MQLNSILPASGLALKQFLPYKSLCLSASAEIERHDGYVLILSLLLHIGFNLILRYVAFTLSVPIKLILQGTQGR